MNYSLTEMKLNLKVNWKLSRNESIFKTNYILSNGVYESEIAPNIRYGENQEVIENNFKEFLNDPNSIKSYWSQSFKNAVCNLKLKENFSGDLFKALNLSRVEKVATSFSLPIMELKEVGPYITKNDSFHCYKIKIDHVRGIELIAEVSKHTDRPLRIDANEAFHSLKDYLFFEKELTQFNIEFIEQPFPAKHIDLYRDLKRQSIYKIIADESILASFDEALFPEIFHGINVKIMKTGGVEKAKELLILAKKYGMQTMIGCMIESSLGISEAYTLCSLCDYVDLDGALLINNDPYENYFEVHSGYLVPTF